MDITEMRKCGNFPLLQALSYLAGENPLAKYKAWSSLLNLTNEESAYQKYTDIQYFIPSAFICSTYPLIKPSIFLSKSYSKCHKISKHQSVKRVIYICF